MGSPTRSSGYSRTAPSPPTCAAAGSSAAAPSSGATPPRARSPSTARSLAARPLVVGIDGRELAGSPTGTGRYLRNLLRHWRETGDELFVYFNGPPALDPVVENPRLHKRPLGDGAARGLVWQGGSLPEAAG